MHYDPESGARLYTKFEMPGYDEDARSGCIEVILEELIEPKVVRPGGVAERAPPVNTLNEEDRTLQQTANALPDKETVQGPADALPEEEMVQEQDVYSPNEETAEVSKYQTSQEDEKADDSWEGIEDTVAEGTETEHTADLAQDTELGEPLDGPSDHEYDSVTYPDLSTEVDNSTTIQDKSTTDHGAAAHQVNDGGLANDQPSEQRTKDPSEEVREGRSLRRISIFKSVLAREVICVLTMPYMER